MTSSTGTSTLTSDVGHYLVMDLEGNTGVLTCPSGVQAAHLSPFAAYARFFSLLPHNRGVSTRICRLPVVVPRGEPERPRTLQADFLEQAEATSPKLRVEYANKYGEVSADPILDKDGATVRLASTSPEHPFLASSVRKVEIHQASLLIAYSADPDTDLVRLPVDLKGQEIHVVESPSGPFVLTKSSRLIQMLTSDPFVGPTVAAALLVPSSVDPAYTHIYHLPHSRILSRLDLECGRTLPTTTLADLNSRFVRDCIRARVHRP